MPPATPGIEATSVPPFKVGDRVRMKTDPPGSFTGELLSLGDGTIGRVRWQNGGSFDIYIAGLALEEPKVDLVNHPSHYTAGGIETIDAIEAMVGQPGWLPRTGYNLGNVLKYLWRHASKGGLESPKKARWYLEREIAAQEKAVKDFLDAAQTVFVLWLFFRVYDLEARLKKTVEALQLLGAAVILGGIKPPEKKP